MHNQTPRHSSTKHIKKQGTINSKVEHWDYTTMCLAVTFELSIFLASFLTLLAGNLSRSILLSFMVLDTNSSSLRRNQKYLCEESWLSLEDT